MQIPLSTHPWIYAFVCGLPTLISAAITLLFIKTETSKRAAWCDHFYSANLPLFVALVGFLLAVGMSWLVDQSYIPEFARLAKASIPWFIALWDIVFGYLSFFGFAMFYDAYRLDDRSTAEFLKLMPVLYRQLIPVIGISLSICSIVSLTIGALAVLAGIK